MEREEAIALETKLRNKLNDIAYTYYKEPKDEGVVILSSLYQEALKHCMTSYTIVGETLVKDSPNSSDKSIATYTGLNGCKYILIFTDTKDTDKFKVYMNLDIDKNG